MLLNAKGGLKSRTVEETHYYIATDVVGGSGYKKSNRTNINHIAIKPDYSFDTNR